MSIEAYDYGVKDGSDAERKRILDWIENNRSSIELVDDVYIYRDHFDSESLMEFISSGSSKIIHRDHEKAVAYKVIKFLESLVSDPSNVTLEGAIQLLKEELK